jgi:hypothetical protein
LSRICFGYASYFNDQFHCSKDGCERQMNSLGNWFISALPLFLASSSNNHDLVSRILSFQLEVLKLNKIALSGDNLVTFQTNMHPVFPLLPSELTRLCVAITHHIPGTWTPEITTAYLALAGRGLDLYMLDVLNHRQIGEYRIESRSYLDLLFRIGVLGGGAVGVVRGWDRSVCESVLGYWRTGFEAYLNAEGTGVDVLAGIARVLHVLAPGDELITVVNRRLYAACVGSDEVLEECLRVIWESGVEGVEELLKWDGVVEETSGVECWKVVGRICEGGRVGKEVLQGLEGRCEDVVLKRRFGVLAERTDE